MFDYYATPNVRDLCHGVKKGDKDAINVIAEFLALQVSADDVLSPVPDRNGVSGIMGLVCERVSELSGCSVWDGIRGAARKSQYESKKNGRSLSEGDLGFSLIGDCPNKNGRHFIVDSIKDTGLTLNTAISLIEGSEPLVFANVDKEAQAQASRLLDSLPDSGINSILMGLKQIEKDSVAFFYLYQAISNNAEFDAVLTRELAERFNYSQHAGVRAAIAHGFVDEFNMERRYDPKATIPSSMAFADFLSMAICNHEAGFYFEEGGCWGFASALYEYAKENELEPQLVMGGDFVHCYVKMKDVLLDHQGVHSLSCRNVVEFKFSELLMLAEKNGVPSDNVIADTLWAKEIIADACDMAKEARPSSEVARSSSSPRM